MDDRRQIHFKDGAFFSALNSPADKMLSFQKIETLFGESTKEKFTSIERGSAVLRFPSANGEIIACTIWIGVNNVSLMFNKEEINSIIFLLS